MASDWVTQKECCTSDDTSTAKTVPAACIAAQGFSFIWDMPWWLTQN
jgi:hypothetical protein